MRNPDVDWEAKIWKYTERSKPSEVLAAQAFFEVAAKMGRMYAMQYAVNGMLNFQELPKEYKEYCNIFSEDKANKLPPKGRPEHAIKLTGDSPHGPIYKLSEKELKILQEYIQNSLDHEWICESMSSAGVPILFTLKKDSELCFCINYWGLNWLIVKNRYPLPLISEILDRLFGARCFTKLDLRNVYHRIYIREGDEWKMVFRTRYGHFEYLIMPFGLVNATATFQAYINRALTSLVNITCIMYLDDILIYLEDLAAHKHHVVEVLESL